MVMYLTYVNTSILIQNVTGTQFFAYNYNLISLYFI